MCVPTLSDPYSTNYFESSPKVSSLGLLSMPKKLEILYPITPITNDLALRVAKGSLTTYERSFFDISFEHFYKSLNQNDES